MTIRHLDGTRGREEKRSKLPWPLAPNGTENGRGVLCEGGGESRLKPSHTIAFYPRGQMINQRMPENFKYFS